MRASQLSSGGLGAHWEIDVIDTSKRTHGAFRILNEQRTRRHACLENLTRKATYGVEIFTTRHSRLAPRISTLKPLLHAG